MKPEKSGRLVVVSNRIADDRLPAGGLVYALHECLSEIGGLWIGTAAEPVETPSDALHDAGGARYQRRLFDVTPEEHAAHYLGYSNAVLWPLFHRRTDLLDQSRDNFYGYIQVNDRLAEQMMRHIKPNDLIWIHDYHFLPLAAALRKRGAINRIGFFLHIPFPNVTDLSALSQAQKLAHWLGAYDLVGLQTARDVAQALACLRSHGHAEILPRGRVRAGDRLTSVLSIPIGIDVDTFQQDAESQPLPALHLREGAQLLVGVDRLDYSKGLVNRFEAFGQYLDDTAHSDVDPTFIQVAPPSRGDVDAYQDFRAELERTAGDINGRHGRLDWTPLRYLCQQVPRPTIAALLRRADVGLVTPLADGMNLVAKEFVAAQDPEDPGVLILSHQAGASEQLDTAFKVNAFDPEDIAQAISQALILPLQERVDRHAAALEVITRADIAWWTRTYLNRLTQSRSSRYELPAVVSVDDFTRATGSHFTA